MSVERTIRLTYPRHLVGQPFLYWLIQQFGVVANIVEARIDAEEAWLILAVSGERGRIQMGLAWLAEQGLTVENVADSANEEDVLP